MRNEAQLTLQVFSYWNKLPGEAVISPSLRFLTSRVDTFLENVLSPRTNDQPSYKWKSMQLNSLCSIKRSHCYNVLYLLALRSLALQKEAFQWTKKTATLKMQTTDIFKPRTWKLFSPHFVDWLCYKLLHSWCQQECYLKITAGLILGFQKICWFCANPDPL